MHKALLFKKLKNQRVECLACNHYCKIAEGKVGLCKVRQNKRGILYSLVYARPSALHLDPIEKKPLYHFLPGTEVLSLGTVGCNFKCDFCQNWSIAQISSPPHQEEGGWLPEKIVEYCVKHKIPSLAYTYNEPTVFFEYAYHTARLAHQEGIKNILVSNGYFSREALDKITPFLDAINIDLKSFKEDFYQRICGARLAPVLENIKELHKRKIWLEVTTLIIPLLNDSQQEQEVKKIAQFLGKLDKAIPWHLSSFYPAYKMEDKPPTPRQTLLKAYQIGKEGGLKYIYLGNIIDREHNATYCPACGEVLIKREAGAVELLWQKKGECNKCKQKIEGVW